MPISRSMGGRLREIRSSLPGNRIARVLFCLDDGYMFLLHGCIKRTKTTPKADLDLARDRKKDIDNERQ
jgi:phage-related protein